MATELVGHSGVDEVSGRGKGGGIGSGGGGTNGRGAGNGGGGIGIGICSKGNRAGIIWAPIGGSASITVPPASVAKAEWPSAIGSVEVRTHSWAAGLKTVPRAHRTRLHWPQGWLKEWHTVFFKTSKTAL